MRPLHGRSGVINKSGAEVNLEALKTSVKGEFLTRISDDVMTVLAERRLKEQV